MILIDARSRHSIARGYLTLQRPQVRNSEIGKRRIVRQWVSLYKHHLLASITLVLAKSGAATSNLRTQRIEGEGVARTKEVRYELLRTLELLIDARAGSRGFATLGSDHALKDYRDATPLFVPTIEHLIALVSENPHQRMLTAQLGGTARDLQPFNETL